MTTVRNRPANASGYMGNNPPETDQPFLIGEIEGRGERDPDWQLWLRRSGCRDPFLALKLVAVWRAKRKANYWFTWSMTEQDFLNWGKDYRTLKATREPLLHAAWNLMLDFTEGKTSVVAVLNAVARGEWRGGAGPKWVYAITPENGPGASEMGQTRGYCPMVKQTWAVPSSGPSSTQNTSGEKCKKGHVAPRRVRDNECMECRKIANREYRARRKLREGAKGRDTNIEDLL